MKLIVTVILAPLFGSWLLAGCSDDTPKEVSFKKDVMPILEKNCVECHMKGGKGAKATDFRLDTYEALMKGTKYGPVVVPGDSLDSVLNEVVEGRVDESIRMPHGRPMLPENDIVTLKAWVDQGAKNN